MTRLPRITLTLSVALLAGGLPSLAARVLPQARPPAQTQGQAGTAQQPAQPPAPSTGAILGQIVDATTGRPIPGAIATLSGGFAAMTPVAPGATLTPAERAALQAANAPRRIMTDESGVFAFLSLPKSSLSLSASATGYLGGGYGQRRANGPTRSIDVDQGERRTGVVIKLWPYGSINGTVSDESGDPAVSAQVRLVRVLTTNGQRRLSTYNSVQTDDRGAYRFGSLTPGDYLIAVPQTVTSVPASTVDAYAEANRTPNGTADMNRQLQDSGAPMPYSSGLRIGGQEFLMGRAVVPPTTENGKTFAYQTIYYPSATTSADAMSVSVASGQDRSGIDLQLRMTQTVKVSGSVTGPDGPAPNMGVKLVPAGQDNNNSVDSSFDTAATATDANGAFTFPAVPTGAYTVRVLKVPRPAPPPPPPPPPPGAAGRAVPNLGPLPPALPVDPVLWAETPVSVGDADVAGVNVALRTGSKISGRVIFDGSATAPTPDMLQRMVVFIGPADGRPSVVNGQGRVGATGQFSTLGYPPGKYTISVGGNLPGWYYKGATLGGKNLDDDPVDLQGADVSGVTITFVDRISQIAGTVHDPAVTRDLSAAVFFFPTDYAVLIDRGTLGRRVRNTSVSGAGVFTMSGLPPGDYLAAAVNPDYVSDTRDKAFYDSLARIATRISIGDGEKKSVDLTVGTIR